ncbi:MAG TPA: hypothetical protein VNV14_00970 [Opitutaceae bacterium]|jgi:hypothetical protein|nr:hypothetical protein [Opitutaceae bacterium]
MSTIPKLLVFLSCTLLISGCMTPFSEAPAAITLSRDLNFEATALLGPIAWRVTITKGHYVWFATDMAAFYYKSEGAQVGQGEPIQKSEGGLGIDRSNGRVFVWKKSVSNGGTVPIGPVFFNAPPAGTVGQQRLGWIPHDLEGALTIER